MNMSYAYSSIYGIPLEPMVKEPLTLAMCQQLEEFYYKHLALTDKINGDNYLRDIKNIRFGELNPDAPEFKPRKQHKQRNQRK